MNRLYKNSNRYEFIETLNCAKSYYLICLDIVNFKSINEKFGFYNGDSLLSEILAYINYLSCKDSSLRACRYENDIIMLMIDSLCESTIIEIVNKIVSNRYNYDISFRAGYKKFNSNKKLGDFLDSIIYVIKDKKYIVNNAFDISFELTIDIEKYITIKQDILNNNSNHFTLVYQPKVTNTNKSITSCEVLSRWNHPSTGQSKPNEFLSIIKSLNKEIEFDLMIFEKACSELNVLQSITNEFSINISIKSISSRKFINAISRIINEFNISPPNITLEILEDLYDYDYIVISNNIDELVKLGFTISIDDFGTGYSSYFRLAELKFSEIKIPRDFLKPESYEIDKKNKKVLSGIVSLCKELNCKIVIEGVETEENVRLAESLNIDYIQGYYYSKPLEKDEYIEFIREYNKRLL